MSNGTVPNGTNGLNGALPPWLRVIVTIVLQQGVAVAIAIFLVWWISSKVIVNQEVILNEVQSHRREAAMAGKMMTDFADKQEETQRTLVLLQLQTCLNVARDVTGRQECARAAR